jgi:hypothetical protein
MRGEHIIRDIGDAVVGEGALRYKIPPAAKPLKQHRILVP